MYINNDRYLKGDLTMNARKLSLALILGGIAVVVLSVIWFFTAYSGAMDMMKSLGGSEMAGKLMACLYSSNAMCQGAGFFSDAPSYSPVVLWIGVVAILAGVIIRFAADKSGSAGPATPASGGEASLAGGAAAANANDKLLGIVAPEKYTKVTYLLILIGAAGGVLVPPLMIIGVVGFVLALLGVYSFKPRLNALDANHLGALSVTFAAAALLLFLGKGSLLFLLIALAQLALYYIGFNSYRHGRMVSLATLKDEARLAVAPLTQRGDKDQTTPGARDPE